MDNESLRSQRGKPLACKASLNIFFPRLLGSPDRTVETQCLCQLNELCSILHRLLFESIKREHKPIHSLNIIHMRWQPHEEKHKKKHKIHKNKAKQCLEDIQKLVHETALYNFTSAQDRRTLSTAQNCLNSLRIRIEVLHFLVLFSLQ